MDAKVGVKDDKGGDRQNADNWGCLREGDAVAIGDSGIDDTFFADVVTEVV